MVDGPRLLPLWKLLLFGDIPGEYQKGGDNLRELADAKEDVFALAAGGARDDAKDKEHDGAHI